MTDPRTLADELDTACDRRAGLSWDQVRAAAALLRHHANLLDAIGDPEVLTFIAGRCLDEAVNIQRGAADPVTTISALSEAAVVVQRIADAATHQDHNT